MLTYTDAKRALDAARKPENGVQHPVSRNARIFWEDDSQKKNIVVYNWQLAPYAGYGRRTDQPADRRKRLIEKLDESYNAAVAEADRGEYRMRNYFGGRSRNLREDYGYIICIIQPNGNYCLPHGAVRVRTRGADPVRLILPDAVSEYSFYLKAINPTAGPAPKEPRNNVPSPRFIGKNGYPFYHNDTSKRGKEKAAKARAEFEQNVTKYGKGSLEHWHERYAAQQTARERWNERMAKWREGHMMDVFPGIVIDQYGVATKASIAANKRAKREAEQRKQERIAAREAEKAAKLKAYTDALKSADAQKIFATLEKGLQKFLEIKQIPLDKDGTVTLMKYVRDSYASGHDRNTVYTPGTWVEDDNYIGKPNCGHGLHFTANTSDADRWSGRRSGRSRGILCKVPLAEAVIVLGMGEGYTYEEVMGRNFYGRENDEQIFTGAKVKAKKCFVIGDCDADGKPVGEQHSPEPLTPEQKKEERNRKRREQRAEDKRAKEQARQQREDAKRTQESIRRRNAENGWSTVDAVDQTGAEQEKAKNEKANETVKAQDAAREQKQDTGPSIVGDVKPRSKPNINPYGA